MPLLNVVIDLSHHNTVTSFQEVKEAGILGVIHKATEGPTFVDSQFDSRRQRALAAGLFWGAYHFGVRGDVQGQMEVLDSKHENRSRWVPEASGA